MRNLRTMSRLASRPWRWLLPSRPWWLLAAGLALLVGRPGVRGLKGTMRTDTTKDVDIPVTGEYEDDNKPIPVMDVWAVLGGKAELPCDINPPDNTDSVYLVLWYRELAGKPLYSFDIRGRPANTARHWSADAPFGFGKRGNFRVEGEPSSLVINSITILDEGVYRCRVDYRNSPTRNIKLNLTIVEEPNAPQITEDTGEDISGAIAGPYNEGEELKLVCHAHGGRPPPQVFWYIDDRLVDETYELQPGRDVVTNRLRYTRLNREMNNKKIKCVATNNNLKKPKTRQVTIEMNLRPQSVKILQKRDFLIEGEKIQITCQAKGSEPAAKIHWFIGDTAITDFRVQHNPSGMTTTSVFSFSPGEGDNRRRIACRAFNPQIPGSTLEDTWTVVVMYKPRLSLTLGRSLDPREIKEGDDVYFECRIVSNPPVSRLEWYHKETRLKSNATAGILLSNQSLVIQKVGRKHGGPYTCRAENRQGLASSNVITLTVKYKPLCSSRTLNNNKFAVDRTMDTDVECHLDSYPPVNNVIWIANRQGHEDRLPSSSYSLGDGFSRLTYKPSRDMDYGELQCYGINAVGQQVTPCIFKIEATGRPYKVGNCTINNKTESSGEEVMEVACVPGFNGGLKQNFTLEIIEVLDHKPEGSRVILRNITRPLPVFQLEGIASKRPVNIKVYAQNSKGRSSEITVAERIRMPRKQRRITEVSSPNLMNNEPLFLVIGGTGIAFILIVALLVIWVVKRRVTGKKLPVVEVCVGRFSGVDRVRAGADNGSRQEEQTPSPDIVKGRYDKASYSTSEKSEDDLSSFQVGGSVTAAVGGSAARSILKTRAKDTTSGDGVGVGREDGSTRGKSQNRQRGQVGGAGGNWYPNPMDQTNRWTGSVPPPDFTDPALYSGYSTLQTRRLPRTPEYVGNTGPQYSRAHKIPPPTGFSAPSGRSAGSPKHPQHIGTLPRHTQDQDPLNFRSTNTMAQGSRTNGDMRRIRYSTSVRNMENDTEYLLDTNYVVANDGPESKI